MAARGATGPAMTGFLKARCRCGHLPTHHMVVESVGTTGNYRLVPSGPCAICGELVCRVYAPGAP